MKFLLSTWSKISHRVRTLEERRFTRFCLAETRFTKKKKKKIYPPIYTTSLPSRVSWIQKEKRKEKRKNKEREKRGRGGLTTEEEIAGEYLEQWTSCTVFEQTPSTKLQRARRFFVRVACSSGRRDRQQKARCFHRTRRREGKRRKRQKWYREKVTGRPLGARPGRSSPGACICSWRGRKFAAPSAQTPAAPKDSNFSALICVSLAARQSVSLIKNSRGS